MKILLASSNPGKLVEMKALLSWIDAEFVSLDQAGIRHVVEETGATYAENATLKARFYSQLSGLMAIADDSGLEVDALGGLPGLNSHRFTGDVAASDADRRSALLKRLEGMPRPWKAHFHCSVAIAVPNGDVYLADGDCPGEIIPEERGTNGFGYDAIFWMPELKRTMAELSDEDKNRVSHRARAVANAQAVLTKLISTSG